MFGLFAKKPQGSVVNFKIEGMHCVSCGMNIDDGLEELDGVLEAKTNFAKAETRIVYNEKKIDAQRLRKTIVELGYTIG